MMWIVILAVIISFAIGYKLGSYRNRSPDTQFESLLAVRLTKLPYVKHLDDGQYNDGQVYGFEIGARWAHELLKRGRP